MSKQQPKTAVITAFITAVITVLKTVPTIAVLTAMITTFILAAIRTRYSKYKILTLSLCSLNLKRYWKYSLN
jgi:hypothetical protein